MAANSKPKIRTFVEKAVYLIKKLQYVILCFYNWQRMGTQGLIAIHF